MESELKLYIYTYDNGYEFDDNRNFDIIICAESLNEAIELLRKELVEKTIKSKRDFYDDLVKSFNLKNLREYPVKRGLFHIASVKSNWE